jgi:hypothetical protein
MEIQLGFIDIIQVLEWGCCMQETKCGVSVRDKTCLGFQQSKREKGEDFGFQQPDRAVHIMA